MSCARKRCHLRAGCTVNTRTVSIFNGLNYLIDITKKGNNYYARLSAKYDQSKAKKETDNTLKEAPKDDEKSTTDLNSPTELSEIARIANNEYKPWIYIIDSNKYNKMTKQLSDLFEKKDNK